MANKTLDFNINDDKTIKLATAGTYNDKNITINVNINNKELRFGSNRRENCCGSMFFNNYGDSLYNLDSDFFYDGSNLQFVSIPPIFSPTIVFNGKYIPFTTSKFTNNKFTQKIVAPNDHNILNNREGIFINDTESLIPSKIITKYSTNNDFTSIYSLVEPIGENNANNADEINGVDYKNDLVFIPPVTIAIYNLFYDLVPNTNSRIYLIGDIVNDNTIHFNNFFNTYPQQSTTFMFLTGYIKFTYDNTLTELSEINSSYSINEVSFTMYNVSNIFLNNLS